MKKVSYNNKMIMLYIGIEQIIKFQRNLKVYKKLKNNRKLIKFGMIKVNNNNKMIMLYVRMEYRIQFQSKSKVQKKLKNNRQLIKIGMIKVNNKVIYGLQ